MKMRHPNLNTIKVPPDLSLSNVHKLRLFEISYLSYRLKFKSNPQEEEKNNERKLTFVEWPSVFSLKKNFFGLWCL